MTDLPGKAIYDYHFKKSESKLFVHDTFGPKDVMPVEIYFRNFAEMPDIERKALQLCDGKILDIGAGAGSHALELQNLDKQTFALEISPTACEVMTSRGVKNVVCEDIFKFNSEKFDTLLLLMNGIGLSGTLDGFTKFLRHAESLLNPGGKLIFDSCDIAYMYEDWEKPTHYYGEVKCRYEYQDELTPWFNWLYLDKKTMQQKAAELGWKTEIVAEDENFQYLAVLTKI